MVSAVGWDLCVDLMWELKGKLVLDLGLDWWSDGISKVTCLIVLDLLDLRQDLMMLDLLDTWLDA